MSGRSCAQCGCVLQMWPIDRKRRRNASGELICDRCSNGTRTHIIPKDSMVSCVHCGGISDRLTVKAGLVVCADGCSLRTVAHDGGDNEVLYHCPFCGGGDLVGRSDGSAECRYCKQVFTVQVQPPSPAHPQTINGEPVDWPGKPGGPLTPEQEKAGLEIQLGPDQGDELEEGPPAVPGAPGAPPVPGEPAPSGLDQSFVQELLGEDPAADPTQPPKPKKSPPSLVAKDSKLYAMSETQFRAWLPNLYSLPSLSSLASGPDDEDWEEAFAYAQSRGASPSRARDFADDQPSPAYLSNEWSRWSKPDDEPEDRYASRMYMTEEGIAMPEDSFLRRLAVRFADDREAVIEDIRSSRH